MPINFPLDQRPDITIERIGELLDYSFEEMRAAAS
jgi:hypothetical protein